MSMLLAHARRNGALPDFDLLRAMLFYIDEFPERLHHPKETQLLFPRLLAKAPQLAPVIGRLDAEHDRGEAAIRELEHALLAFEVMGPSRRDDFEAAAKRYIDGYLSHMATEEHEVLPVARQAFDEADWRELDDAFEANRDPLTGHAPSEEFRALFSRIATVAPAPIGLG
jgi:hemerythrin-like domain-containing protein